MRVAIATKSRDAYCLTKLVQCFLVGDNCQQISIYHAVDRVLAHINCGNNDVCKAKEATDDNIVTAAAFLGQ